MLMLVATAFANPARESILLPGTAMVDAGHGHVGFRAAGVLIEPFSLGGISMGFAPFRGAYVDAEVLQSPEQPALRVAQATARVTLVDTDPFSLAVFGGALWYEEGFDGFDSAGLAGGIGFAVRFGSRRRAVDFSMAPASLLALGSPGEASFGTPSFLTTPYIVTAGWTRPFGDRVSVRVGWPDGISFQYRSKRAYFDVSVLAIGVPLFGGTAAGLKL